MNKLFCAWCGAALSPYIGIHADGCPHGEALAALNTATRLYAEEGRKNMVLLEEHSKLQAEVKRLKDELRQLRERRSTRYPEPNDF